MKNKVAIIGGGNVGSTLIYTLLNGFKEELEIVLIDNHEARGKGNVEDFRHCLFKEKKIYLGSYNDIDDCDMIVIACGIKNSSNRKAFLRNSFYMIRNIVEEINKTKFKGYVLVLSNPNDVITTYIAKNYKYTEKVLGSGTLLDNYRLKYFLAENKGYNISMIDTQIIGEHGATQVMQLDKILINKKKITLNSQEKNDIANYVNNIPLEIVSLKGYTNYGVCMVALEIINCLLLKDTKNLIVSTYDNEIGVAYSCLCHFDKDMITPLNRQNERNIVIDCIEKIKSEYEIFVSGKIIGIDLDDTITDIYDDMLIKAKEFDKKIGGTGIIKEDEYFMGEKFGWSKETKEKFFKEERLHVVDNAKIRKNARKVFKKCIDEGYLVIIITARKAKYYNNPYEYTYNWLRKHKIPFSKLIVESLKKDEVCLKEKVDIFIDDMDSNCQDVAKLKNVKVYMMENANNESLDKRVKKITGFDELWRLIINERN